MARTHARTQWHEKYDGGAGWIRAQKIAPAFRRRESSSCVGDDGSASHGVSVRNVTKSMMGEARTGPSKRPGGAAGRPRAHPHGRAQAAVEDVVGRGKPADDAAVTGREPPYALSGVWRGGELSVVRLEGETRRRSRMIFSVVRRRIIASTGSSRPAWMPLFPSSSTERVSSCRGPAAARRTPRRRHGYGSARGS